MSAPSNEVKRSKRLVVTKRIRVVVRIVEIYATRFWLIFKNCFRFILHSSRVNRVVCEARTNRCVVEGFACSIDVNVSRLRALMFTRFVIVVEHLVKRNDRTIRQSPRGLRLLLLEAK